MELLSDNYSAVAQTVNLLAEWMIQAGVDIKDVQEMVENHLKEMILKTFDPKKADSIFSDEGEVLFSEIFQRFRVKLHQRVFEFKSLELP